MLIEKPDIINILPVNDSQTHLENELCRCKPVIENRIHEGKILIIHNSFDGREFVERLIAAIILN